MSRDSIKKVMGELFGLTPEQIPDDATMETLDAWDSLNHMELMLAIEIEFGVRMTATSMLDLVSLDAICDFLKAQGSGAK